MKTAFTIRPITADETHELRHEVLRPHQPINELVYPGDNAPESLHAGAFHDGALVGIASVFRDAPPGETHPTAWRLRGMATHPTMQRRGIGRALIAYCVAHIQAHCGTMLWCNGRTSARAFYESMGFRVVGEEFETETGLHFVFRREL